MNKRVSTVIKIFIVFIILTGAGIGGWYFAIHKPAEERASYEQRIEQLEERESQLKEELKQTKANLYETERDLEDEIFENVQGRLNQNTGYMQPQPSYTDCDTFEYSGGSSSTSCTTY